MKNIAEDTGDKSEKELVEAERRFTVYATAPFVIILSTLMSLFSIFFSFIGNNLNEFGQLIALLVVFIMGSILYIIADRRLKNQVLPKLEELRINKILHERETLKKENESLLKLIGIEQWSIIYQNICGQTSQNGLEQELIAYLTFLQNIISRMNTNCMQCKIACIALTAGLMTAITAFKNAQIYILFFMIFIQIVFMFYDGMYLVFERHYREVYTDTIKSWQDGDLHRKNIFCLQSPDIHLISCKTYTAVVSSSIWPLYLILAVFPVIILVLTRGTHA